MCEVAVRLCALCRTLVAIREPFSFAAKSTGLFLLLIDRQSMRGVDVGASCLTGAAIRFGVVLKPRTNCCCVRSNGVARVWRNMFAAMNRVDCMVWGSRESAVGWSEGVPWTVKGGSCRTAAHRMARKSRRGIFRPSSFRASSLPHSMMMF